MIPSELKNILDLHKLWLANDASGKRADLTNANLRGADLTNANLRGANLTNANLTDANLRRANLTDADLWHADLRRANLTDADLTDADLTDANLWHADLKRANLWHANLRRADLTDVNLTDANLTDANLTLKQVPHIIIVPNGKLIVYKKLYNSIVATLEVPEHAQRVNSTSRKCRCSEAVVLKLSAGAKKGISKHDASFSYRLGEIVKPDRFDPDFRVECSAGIHFFITKQEAMNYE